MKYASLPTLLLKFWYPDAVQFIGRTWKNIMLYLEEDLAVVLMWKLIFTPLFHDSSIVGRILSVLFRLSRIIIGLFAFAIATIVLLFIGGYWLILPVLAIFDAPQLISRILFLSGLGLFFLNFSSDPHKKVWQIKNINNIWEVSLIKKEKLSFKYLLMFTEVQELLTNLELEANGFPQFEITDANSLGQKAFQLARLCQSPYITARHFFVAAVYNMPETFLSKFELTAEDFEKALIYLEKKLVTWRRVYIWDDDFTVHHLKGVNRGWLGIPTPILDEVSIDLTKEAASKGFPELRRENSTLKEITGILSQSSGRNVILAGPPGSGKTATLKYLAKQVVAGDAPEALATKRIVILDLTKLLSGIKTQGDLASKIKTIFEEVQACGNTIIAIEEIHELGIGEAGASLNLYSLIQPYLESDSFQFIGTTEPENYSRILEKNGSFARIFRKVELPPASYEDTVQILEDKAIEAERKQKIRVTFIAIKTAALLSKKLIHDRVLPDSAISVFKETLTQPVNKWVTKDVVRRVLSQRVKVPLMEVGGADKSKLLNLESAIHERMIDQEQAVKAVADTLRRSAAGLRDENRPIGSFLFVGPTGVGKTELARTLSEVYFKTAGAYLRFDMSEYQNSQSLNRLIGGQEQEGQLTEAVRSRPYALLLLDEFEKADPKILTLFLQVFEDGRLTDAGGRTADFTNTIIIATSNVGSLTIARALQEGRSLKQLDKEINEELLKIFKPELVNRFDEVVLFKPLLQEDLQKIVAIKLNNLQKQMREKGYLIEFSPQIISEFAKRGFDPVLGARPMRRLLQDTLETKLSSLILENKIRKGEVFRAGSDLFS